MKNVFMFILFCLSLTACADSEDSSATYNESLVNTQTKKYVTEAFKNKELIGSWSDAGVKFAVYNLGQKNAVYVGFFEDGTHTVLDTLLSIGDIRSEVYVYQIPNGIDSGGIFTIDSRKKRATYLDRTGDEMKYQLLNE